MTELRASIGVTRSYSSHCSYALLAKHNYVMRHAVCVDQVCCFTLASFPGPVRKNRKRGLVALPCIFCCKCKRLQMRATVGHAFLQPLMSADCHANACKMNKSELNKRCCSMLSSMFIYPVWMHTVCTQVLTSSQLIGTQARPVPTEDQGVCLDNPYK